MVHRDPNTGEFVSDDAMSGFDDIEVVTFSASSGVTAGDLGGGTGFAGGERNAFEGIEVVDYDEIVDRNEELHLLQAQHRITAYVNSTSTSDGTVAASIEVSADPALTDATRDGVTPSSGSPVGPDDVTGDGYTDDSIDIIGRPLAAVGHAPFSDGASGAGGGGSAGEDSYTMSMAPAEFGRFHPRDELFVNGRLVTWNVADAAVHIATYGQHVYGVIED